MTLPAVRGVDISTYQTTTPTGFDFYICRATYGAAGIDARYAQHAADVRAMGKPLGAYAFWYDGQDNATAVATFLRVAGDADFWALDLEGTNANTVAGKASAADFIAKFKATGREIGLYHSFSGYPALGQDWRWVALWGTSTPPSIPYDVWQYGPVNGLDLDYCDAATLQNVMGGSAMYAVDTRTPLAAPNPRHFTIPANTTLYGYDPAQPGKPVRSFGPSPTASGANADSTDNVAWYQTSSPPVPRGGPFLHVVDGALAGLLVVASLVQLDPPTPPPPTPTPLGSGVYQVK